MHSINTRPVRTSRILNDQSFFMGLSHLDISGLALVLLGFLLICKAAGGSPTLALGGTIVAASVLIPIRLKYRRKILRDFIRYFIQKIFMKRNNA